MKARLAVAVAFAAVLSGGTTLAQEAGGGDPAAGAAVYRSRCSGCHAVDANGYGPSHRGVFGRRPAQAAGYAYSEALKRLDGVWDARSLDAWLADPRAFAPGARMSAKLNDPRQRADVIAYLRSLSR